MEQCYYPDPPSDPIPCRITANFPTGLTIRYTRNTFSDPLAIYQRVTSANTNDEIVYVSGLPALLYGSVANDPAVQIQFVAGGTRIDIIGRNSPYDAVTLESLAKSIIDQANASNP